MTHTNALRAVLLAGAATLAFAPQAHAAAKNTDAKIETLQQQVQQLNAELQELKRQQAAEQAQATDQVDVQAALADLKRSTSAQYQDIQDQRANDVQVSLKNGRPTLATADGNFSVSLRTLVQYDTGYYSQSTFPTANTDFSSGSNFRRARFGASGTLFKDWSYEFIYDFGGSGTEGSTISSAFIQYDGFGPVHIKLGAYAPPEGFEDQTSASDLLFLERAQPTDVARSIAAADGRDAATIFAYDDNYFAALSYTGGVVGDTAVFDEQQSLVARGAYRFVKTPDANLAIGGDTTYVFKLADTTSGPTGTSAFRLRERPELNIDSNNIRLVDTGTINADHVWEWGVEAAGNWQNLYAQGGYYGYTIYRRNSVLSDPSFDGWYVQASWVLTGEAKPYKADKAAYGLPTPSDPFTLDKSGIGAWELAGRYSVIDLDDNAGLAGFATPAGGVRGGRQSIWTAGINWYPNNAIRFLFNYEHTDVSRLSGAGANIGGKLDTVALRAQLSL
ncbi:MAG TPA: porin [Rhizomicrobium sp.]|nr:porin [Rhizomicrobium sp.]